MGHDVRVGAEYYPRIPEELYAKAAGVATEAATNGTAVGEGASKSLSGNSGRTDSNRQHSAWKADALPIELHPQSNFFVSSYEKLLDGAGSRA